MTLSNSPTRVPFYESSEKNINVLRAFWSGGRALSVVTQAPVIFFFTLNRKCVSDRSERLCRRRCDHLERLCIRHSVSDWSTYSAPATVYEVLKESIRGAFKEFVMPEIYIKSGFLIMRL